jgi:epoxyqueuosine reductase
MPDPRDVGFVDLVWLLELSHEEYVQRFRGTAIKRAKLWMLQRNAAVALGNVGDESALPSLDGAMRTNPHPVVRGHAAWAIGRIGLRLGSLEARSLLDAARIDEGDPSVIEEIDAAIAEMAAG